MSGGLEKHQKLRNIIYKKNCIHSSQPRTFCRWSLEPLKIKINFNTNPPLNGNIEGLHVVKLCNLSFLLYKTSFEIGAKT